MREETKSGKSRTTERFYGDPSRKLSGNHQKHTAGMFCQLCGAWYGSLGLEPTPEQHVENIVEICREVRRVLRDDGVFWLNYGDSYGSGSRKSRDLYPMSTKQRSNSGSIIVERPTGETGQLMLMPHRVALALQQDGWIVRQDLVWFKRNPMPESVNGNRWVKHQIKTEASRQPRVAPGIRQGGNNSSWPDQAKYVDCTGCVECDPNDGFVLKRGSWRHTRAHEYVFMLVKGMQYWSNQEAVREVGTSGPSDVRKMEEGLDRIGGKHKTLDDPLSKASAATHIGQKRSVGNPSGRNPRSVLDVPTQPYRGAHYATFPVNLIAPLIRATCPRWACPVCGQGWAPVVETEYRASSEGGPSGVISDSHDPRGLVQPMPKRKSRHDNVLGYRPTCEHPHTQEEAVPGIVFDPFVGSGTTVKVAQDLLRRGIGLDISRPYLNEQAKLRTGFGIPPDQLEGLPLFE